MAVKGKRGPMVESTAPETGQSTPDPVDALIEGARRDKARPKTERLRTADTTPVKPVVVSAYTATGSSAPNVDYGTEAEELDVAGELAKLEEGRRFVIGGTEDNPVAVETLPPVVKLPMPPTRNMQNPREFFAYWASIPKPLQDRVVTYVYRKFPIINKYWCPQCEATLTSPGKSNRGKPCVCASCGWVGTVNTHIDKLVAPIEPRDVIQLYGTGHYMFMLVDTERGGGILCSTVVVTETDYRTYPPAITDKRDVVKDDPGNRAYVEYLRANRVKLRGDQNTENEEDYDMAQRDGLVETLVTKVIQMTDNQRERIERGRGLRDRKTQRDMGVPASKAMDEMASLMSRTAQQSNQFILDTVKRTKDMEGDPLQTIRTVGSLIKEFSGGGGNGGDAGNVIEIMKTFMAREADHNKAVLHLYQMENERVMKELERLRLQQMQPAAQPKTLRETLQEMAQCREVIRDIMGIDGDEGGSKSNGFDWAGLTAQILPAVINGAIAISHNMAIAAQAGKVGPDGQPVATAAPMAPIAPQQPQQAAPQQPQPVQQQTQPVQETEDVNMGQILAYQQLFRKMEPRLIEALEMTGEPDSGFIFADEMIAWNGVEAYNAVKAMGLETLTGVLMQWSGPRIKEIALTNPAHFNTFLNQFLTAQDEEVSGGPVLEGTTGDVKP
jgi:hypothetical protein